MGQEIIDTGTYWQTVRPGGVLYGEGHVLFMTSAGDVVDWVGGYPFEVAKPEEIFDFFRRAGFDLQTMKTCAGGLGCNEFVFLLKATPDTPQG